MGDVWDKFLSNCKRSIDIGIIRYNLYSLSLLIIPIFLSTITLMLGFTFSFVLDDPTALYSGMASVMIFGVFVFIFSVFITVYAENCMWKAYVHTINTGEKLSYSEFFKLGKKGYLSYFGKSLLNLILPMILVAVIASMLYVIPFVGFFAGDFVIVFAATYFMYRFYSKLLDVSYNDFKLRINDYILLILLSTIFGLFEISILDLIVTLFFVPISLILISSKKNDNNLMK